MPIAGIIGVAIGLLGAFGGVFTALWATGMFEYLGGRKKAAGPATDKQTLLDHILSVNSPDLPYQIKTSDKTDLELTWKIADAHWLGVFAMEKLSKTYRAFIYLDESKHTVRFWQAIDNVEWVAGAPKVHFQNDFFRGRVIYQKSAGVQYGIKEDKSFGKVFQYNFDINQVTSPVRQKVLEGGWEFVEVMMKNHAMKPGVQTYQSQGT